MNKSGTQLLVSGLGVITPSSRQAGRKEEACRICGGTLDDGYTLAADRSENWTDENLCQRRDSEYICSACHWFTVGKNRTSFWRGNAVVFAAEHALQTTSPNGLLNLLATSFSLPSIFLIRGNDPNIPRKHQQWRTIEGVTYSRAQTKVALVGLQAFKAAKLYGLAVFDCDELLEGVSQLSEQVRCYLLPTMEKMKTDWQKRNYIYSKLMEGTQRSASPATLLLSYLTAYAVIPAEERTGQDE